ncbi:MAG: hypothetical protein IPK75_18920 [Acidobacteria bacterium]|nr:hypothetical protein [Acidobacteriota bacterium]
MAARKKFTHSSRGAKGDGGSIRWLGGDILEVLPHLGGGLGDRLVERLRQLARPAGDVLDDAQLRQRTVGRLSVEDVRVNAAHLGPADRVVERPEHGDVRLGDDRANRVRAAQEEAGGRHLAVGGVRHDPFEAGGPCKRGDVRDAQSSAGRVVVVHDDALVCVAQALYQPDAERDERLLARGPRLDRLPGPAVDRHQRLVPGGLFAGQQEPPAVGVHVGRPPRRGELVVDEGDVAFLPAAPRRRRRALGQACCRTAGHFDHRPELGDRLDHLCRVGARGNEPPVLIVDAL